MLVEKVATLRIAQNHATLQARQQQQLQQYTEDLKRIDGEIAQKQANIQVISENEQQLLNHEQAVMTLRATLSQNDPCPVCGQTVHHVEADADIEQIKRFNKKIVLLSKHLKSLKNKRLNVMQILRTPKHNLLKSVKLILMKKTSRRQKRNNTT